jgi:hypothetical protein
MAWLAEPSVEVHKSFLAAMAEFVAEGRGPGDRSVLGDEIGEFGPTWGTAEGFAAYVDWLRAQSSEPSTRSPPGSASTPPCSPSTSTTPPPAA